jgi:HAD superfamily hydrolase (TIGR01549 family)
MIQAVFFDLFETLISEWEDNQKKATYSVKELGIDEDCYNKEWSVRRDRRMNGTFTDHQSVLKDILKANGKTVDDNIIEKIHQQRVYVKSVPFKKIDNDIIKTLQCLKEMNIKVGLISNCASEEVQGWYTSSLADLFDDVIFSYKVKQYKPYAEIYLTACENLSVSPQNSIFIGDGGSNELLGAAKVGMKPCQATWFQPSDITEKITGFPRLNKPMDVIDLVKKINCG